MAVTLHAASPEHQSERHLGSAGALERHLDEARRKIAEDVLRFRTCCADPRASK
jgi:hypothetical protein